MKISFQNPRIRLRKKFFPDTWKSGSRLLKFLFENPFQVVANVNSKRGCLDQQCGALDDSAKKILDVNIFDLHSSFLKETAGASISVRPQHVWITSPSPEIILAGVRTVFKCSSSGSRPPAVIQWFKGDEKMSNATIVVSSNSSSSSPLPVLPSKLNGDEWHTSVLEFVPCPEDDGKQLTCKADNPAMPTRGAKGSAGDSNAIVDGVKLKVHCELNLFSFPRPFLDISVTFAVL